MVDLKKMMTLDGATILAI